MTSVFVLHAIEDQALASKVAEALLLEGHAVRKDLSRIEREPGPMIVVWSPAATRDQSVVDWTAVMMERELLIPVCVGLPINPEEFESTPPIDLSGWGGDLDDPRWRFVMDEVALMDQREQLHDGEVWSDASTPIPEAAADSIEPQQSLEPETLERPADEPPAAPAEPQFIQETFLEWPAPALEQVAAEAVSSLEKEGDWDTPEDVQTAEPAPYETDFLQGELFSEGGANEARDTGVYMPSGFSPRQVLWGGGALLLATALGALTVGSIMLNRPAQVQDPVNGPMAATEEPAPAVIDPVEEPQIAVAQVRGERFVVPDATVDKAPDPAPTAVTAPTLDLAAADDVPSPSLADLTPRPPTLAPSRQATVDEAAPAESLVQLALIDEGFIGEGDVSYEPEETSITAEAPAGDFVGVEQQTGAGSFDALADAALDDDLAANELDSLVAVVALETNANTDVTESSNLGAYLRDCFDCPDMASLPAGSFMMGAAADESGAAPSEKPQHGVRLQKGFAIATKEVTFKQWLACVADGGCARYAPPDAGWGQGDQPVINVSFEDAQQYTKWLSEKTGRNYRLPTEAEWEFAARGGQSGPFSFNGKLSSAIANFNGQLVYNGPEGPNRARTMPVASFAPNAYGLYDMHGNVWEWTADCWTESHADAPQDGSARLGDCSKRVLKGGAFNTGGWRLRASHRIEKAVGARESDNGFRVARDL